MEGTNEPLSGTGSLDGDPEGNVGLTYEWDFDNDGDYDDATGATTGFDRVGQDGVYTVGLKVTNQYGFSDTTSTTVVVTNVAPTVTIGNDGPKAENTAVTVSGVVSDAGWLETPLTATINWGDGAAATALSGTVEEVRPFKTITYSEQHTYGDNGTFTVTVCPRTTTRRTTATPRR